MAPATATLETRRAELNDLVVQLHRVLEPGLAERLRSADWYLTGVKVGLESLNAFCRIAEMVYRESNPFSEGARRVANMRKVHAALTEFARPDQTIAQRVRIMLEIRQPLDMLVREFEGSGKSQPGPSRQRQRQDIITALASDIRLNLLRIPSLRKMSAGLADINSLALVLLRGAKRRQIEDFHRNFAGFAESFGFSDPNVLMSRKFVKSQMTHVEKEIKRTERWLGELHRTIYHDRFQKLGTSQVTQDLAPDKLNPVLLNIAKDGFEFLDRAHSAYLHALQFARVDVSIFHRAAELGTELADAESAAAMG